MTPRRSLSPAALLRAIGGDVHAIARPGPSALAEVGRLGTLPCWSATLPPSGAAAAARRLAVRGILGLLIADDPTSDRRSLVVSVIPARVAVVSRDAADALPLLRLARLTTDGTALGIALAAAQALDVDAAGRRAFRALRSGIEQASGALPRAIPADERHAWVLLQVTRLLFLRFVEAEGWLDRRANFLAASFDRCLCLGRNPEREFLRPLFHGTLNREPATRSRLAQSFGAIPFLNGGLFEPHPIERRRRWTLPPAEWRQLFALLVESFEVTLDHGDVGDRVSPELMGRVFEGVMEPATRREGGTYYTPSELVPPMVRESVAVHLAARLGRPEEAVWSGLADPDPELLAAMSAIRVLDPACGSGAFLVGALHLLSGPSRTAATISALLATRLHGVDRNPAAVRIAELRLWLELLRTMRERPIERIPPLPNLDTTIRVGDALLDPFAGAPLPLPLRRQLHRLRVAVRTLHGPTRREHASQLMLLEHRAARWALGHRIASLRDHLAECREGARPPDLFGATASDPPAARRRIAALQRELERLRREHRDLALQGTAPSFGIESAFASTIARGGFDLVIGNPPWVRAERLPHALRARLAGRYRWWRTAGSGWRHAPDLAVAFLERGTELLAPGGTLGFLIPSKLATVGYAAHCRSGLRERCSVDVLAELADDPRAQFGATTYPLALVATRRRVPENHAIRLGFGPEAPRLPHREHANRATWGLSSPALQQLAVRLSGLSSLAATLQPSLGVKTGANAIFLDPDAELAVWTRPAIRGRDVSSLLATPSTRLLWPADSRGNPFDTLPTPLVRHLAPLRARLENRADFAGGHWWQLFRTRVATCRWRVIWPDLASELKAAPLATPDPVPLNSCYVVSVRSAAAMHALSAWLCSTPIRALARLQAEPAANGYARFGARAVGAIPLPDEVLADPVLEELGADHWSPRLLAALDAHVGLCLEISPHEREAIDAFQPARR